MKKMENRLKGLVGFKWRTRQGENCMNQGAEARTMRHAQRQPNQETGLYLWGIKLQGAPDASGQKGNAAGS